MKTFYTRIQEGENPEDYKQIEIDLNMSNQDSVKENLQTFYIKK